MRHTTRVLAALTAALLLPLPGCGGSGGSAPPAFSINRVGWIEENIDPTFWSTPPPSGQTAFYDFFIHYDGDVAFEGFRSVRIFSPEGRFWEILRDATFLDTTAKVIGGYGHWYSGTVTNVLPLGDMQVQVILADGREFQAPLAVAPPGSAVSGSSAAMYTEDVLSPPAGASPMVRRVTMGPDATLDAAAQTITLSFSTIDPLAYGGWIWVYDAAGTYLGVSRLFRDPVSELVSPSLGGVLHTDGTANTLLLPAADLRFEAGATFSQIDRVRVVMTDGAQYAARTSYSYDCRSVGPVATLTRL